MNQWGDYMKPITIEIKDLLDYKINEGISFSTEYFVFSYNHLTSETNRLHYHTSYEIEFLVDGEIEMMINSVEYHCTPGHCWIVMPNSFHRCVNLTESTSIISIKFTEKALAKEIFLALKKKYPYYTRKTTDDELNYVKEIIDNLFIELGRINTEAFRFTVIKCALSQIIGKLFDNTELEDCNSNTNTYFPRNLIDSVDFVKKNFIKKLSRDEIAKQFGFSPSYYSTLFKKYTNKSFSDFVLGERLNFAYYLLLTTDTPVGIISESSGFDTFAYFSKAFKKAYGISPSQLKASNNFIE